MSPTLRIENIPEKKYAQQKYVEQQDSPISSCHVNWQHEYCHNKHDQQGDETGISQPVRLQ